MLPIQKYWKKRLLIQTVYKMFAKRMISIAPAAKSQLHTGIKAKFIVLQTSQSWTCLPATRRPGPKLGPWPDSCAGPKDPPSYPSLGSTRTTLLSRRSSILNLTCDTKCRKPKSVANPFSFTSINSNLAWRFLCDVINR